MVTPCKIKAMYEYSGNKIKFVINLPNCIKNLRLKRSNNSHKILYPSIILRQYFIILKKEFTLSAFIFLRNTLRPTNR